MQSYKCFFEQLAPKLLQLINEKSEHHQMSKHRTQMFGTVNEIVFELISLVF